MHKDVTRKILITVAITWAVSTIHFHVMQQQVMKSKFPIHHCDIWLHTAPVVFIKRRKFFSPTFALLVFSVRYPIMPWPKPKGLLVTRAHIVSTLNCGCGVSTGIGTFERRMFVAGMPLDSTTTKYLLFFQYNMKKKQITNTCSSTWHSVKSS